MKGLFWGNILLSDDKIQILYGEGFSCADIAARVGCSETSIYNRLKLLNTPMRTRSEANQLFPDSIFIALYNIGLSSSQIGRILGVNASTVTKRLHTLNFPLRSRSVASGIRYTEKEFVDKFMTTDMVDQITELIH